MDIISKLGKLLTKSVKTHILVLTASATSVAAVGKELPELLATKEQEAGDNYKSDKREDNIVYAETARNNKKALRKKYNVKRYENGLYNVKNFFRDQDIISKLERKNVIDENTDVGEIKEAARQYFRDEIGIGKGYSIQKLKKNCDDMTKKFILEITHLPEEQRNELIEVYSSVIGELSADMRADLAKDFISIAESDSETNQIAKSLAMNAEYNVTNTDALGRIMKQTDAVDYQRTAFANMNENGINETLQKMSTRSGQVNERIKELKSKPTLTNEEQTELENLELVKQNYSEGGYAAAMTGVPANRFVNPDYVDSCLDEILQKVNQLGIYNDVINLAREYLKEHPEAAQEIINNRSTDFETLLEKAILKRSEVWTANKTTSSQTAKGIGSARSKSAELKSGMYDNISNGAVTDPIPTSSESRLLAGFVSKTSQKREQVTNNRNTTIPEINTPENNSTTKEKKQSADALCQKAMQSGVEEYLEYEKENKINLIESCLNILNYGQANRSVKQLALTRFKTMISKKDKKGIFEEKRLNTSGQIAAMQVMTMDEISSINSFSSSFAKEYAQKLINEEKKQV